MEKCWTKSRYEQMSNQKKRTIFKPKHFEEGFAYKLNKSWEDIQYDEIIYIPEYGYLMDGRRTNYPLPIYVYTKNDFLVLCKNEKRTSARELFEKTKWEFPEDVLSKGENR